MAASSILRVSTTGRISAACKILSEYALPIPLKSLGISERSLERVVLAAQLRGKLGQARLQDLQAAPDLVAAAPRGRAEMQGSAALATASVRVNVPLAN